MGSGLGLRLRHGWSPGPFPAEGIEQGKTANKASIFPMKLLEVNCKAAILNPKP